MQRITYGDWQRMSWHARMTYQARVNKERRRSLGDDLTDPHMPELHPSALVSAEPARQHIAALVAAGMRLKDIAAAAGVSIGVIASIRRKKQVAQRTASKASIALLSVPLPTAPVPHPDTTHGGTP